jgi:hypothetical protein
MRNHPLRRKAQLRVGKREDNWGSMMHNGFTRGQARLSGLFAFSGRWRTPLHVRARAISLSPVFVTLILATPAAARPEMGPSSSASIGISVSVAPNYGLKAERSGLHELSSASGGRFCIATNGRPSALPVALVRSSSRQSSEASEELPWCQPGRDLTERNEERGAGSRNFTLLLIRPE